MQRDGCCSNEGRTDEGADSLRGLLTRLLIFFGRMWRKLNRLDDMIFGLRVGILLKRYSDDGCPDRYLKQRLETTQATELRNVAVLQGFWGRIRVTRICLATCYEYYHWRVARVTRGNGGGRTVELEFNTLRNALRHAERLGLVKALPNLMWPGFCPEESVRHCRECMPANATEVHALAERFFSGRPCTHVLGFLVTFLADTGLRPCEAVILRVDAGPEEPGHVTPDGKLLRVKRGKRQAKVNPWCPFLKNWLTCSKPSIAGERSVTLAPHGTFPAPSTPRCTLARTRLRER